MSTGVSDREGGAIVERHAVWFERPVLPDLVDEVKGRARILCPPPTGDPHWGIAEASAIIAGASQYDASVMDLAPQLRVIARTGIGVDQVDLAEATRRGVAVCNAPDAPTISTAEHTMALLLAVAKNIPRAAAELRGGATNMYARYTGMELDGKTLGLVGFGRIARRVASAAGGLGMQIVASDPFLHPDGFGEAERAESLGEMLGASDAVSLHVPLTEETARLIAASQFAAMRPGAILINTARGGLVDHDALLSAIDAGTLAGAGLDVTDPEPLPTTHPLLQRDNVIVTPHIGSGTYDGKRRLFRSAFHQAIAVLDGEKPAHIVNPDVWGRREITT